MTILLDKSYFLSESKDIHDNSIVFYGLSDLKKFNLSYYNFWNEVIIATNISLPNNNPSIKSIDSINTSINIVNYKLIRTPYYSNSYNPIDYVPSNFEGKKLTGKKLLIDGFLSFNITYIDKTNCNNLYTFTSDYPFSTAISLPNTLNGIDYIDLCTFDFNIISCLEKIVVKDFSETSIMLNISMVIQSIPFMKNTIDYNNCSSNCNHFMYLIDKVTAGVFPQNKIDSILLDTYDNYWTELMIPEILNVPSNKAPISEVLSIASNILILEQTIIETPLSNCFNYEGFYETGKRLIIHLIIKQRITYLSYTTCSNESVYSLNFDIPISTYINLSPSHTVYENLKLTPYILDVSLYKLNDYKLYKNTSVFLKADILKGVKL